MSVVHYFGSRQQGGTLDSTARFYHESPLHEERGSVTQFGTDVPRLRDGWEWRLSSGALSLYHAASLSVLDSVKVAAFTESGRRSRISGAAYKMASRVLLQQLHRAAADWYARDYFADGVLPSPPMSGFLNLADMLPALPAGQHWRVKYGPSFQLSRMQGEEVLVTVALKNARAAATSAAYVTEADVEQLVRAAI